jgi:hypothetical protein
MKTLYLKPHPEDKNTREVFKELIKRASKANKKELFHVGLVQEEGYIYFSISVNDDQVSSLKTSIRGLFPHIDFDDSNFYNIKEKPFSKTAIVLKKSDGLPISTSVNEDIDPIEHLIEVFQEYSQYSNFMAIEMWLDEVEDILTDKIRQRYSLFRAGGATPEVQAKVQEKFKTKQFYSSLNLVENFQDEAKRTEFLSDLKLFLGHLGMKDANSLVVKDERQELLLTQPLKNPDQLLSIDEMVSILHFPARFKSDSKMILKETKDLPVPKEVAEIANHKETTIFAKGLTPGKEEKIGIKQEDRNTHMYIIGKTGSGKTKLLELLMRSDFEKGKGVIFLDPHGDTAENIIRYIPKSREKDVIYVDFTISDFVFAFNPLESTRNSFKEISVENFLSIFQKFFSVDWNPKLEFLLRQVFYALSYSNKGTVLEIPKLLTDPEFRQKLIESIEDDSVRNFWSVEFNRFAESYATQAVSPLLNKISQMLTNTRVRRILSIPRSSFDIEEIVQGEKILIINLSVGELGEFSSSFLGSMIISKILQVMLAQADLAEDKRSQINLYVDEFQNFSTESFIKILSEARKYKLALTIAHQYLEQIPEPIRKAILGNVGSIVSFRLGQSDANLLSKEFKPYLKSEDFVRLSSREFWGKLAIDGKTSKPFLGKTLDLDEPESDMARTVKNASIQQAYLAKEVDKMTEGELSFTEKDNQNNFTAPIS